jgi:hypothetical protein
VRPWWQATAKNAKKVEKQNDERRLYERIIDMERVRSEAALSELTLLRNRVKAGPGRHCPLHHRHACIDV